MSKTRNKKREIKFFRDDTLWSQNRFERYLDKLSNDGYSVIGYKKNFNWFGLGEDIWEIVVEK